MHKILCCFAGSDSELSSISDDSDNEMIEDSNAASAAVATTLPVATTTARPTAITTSTTTSSTTLPVATTSTPTTTTSNTLPVAATASNTTAIQVQGFDWDLYPDEDPFYPEWLPSYQRQRRILVDTTDYNVVDYFYLFFPVEAFQLLQDQTNAYAMQFFDNTHDLPDTSRFSKGSSIYDVHGRGGGVSPMWTLVDGGRGG